MVKLKYEDLSNEYKEAVEKFIGNGFKLTKERFESLYDMEFGLAMFNTGKKIKK